MQPILILGLLRYKPLLRAVLPIRLYSIHVQNYIDTHGLIHIKRINIVGKVRVNFIFKDIAKQSSPPHPHPSDVAEGHY